MDNTTSCERQLLNEDPRAALADWANQNDGWIRRIVRHVLNSNEELTENERAQIYDQLREERGIHERTSSLEPKIVESKLPLVKPDSLHLKAISNVKGVNALAEGERIDFGRGLTLLFGENGAGKTGYVRILKKIAGSRSANEILPNVNFQTEQSEPSARIDYSLGDEDFFHNWTGDQGQPPFTLMSLFDNAAAQYHVDSDLQYTYRPSSLALFDRVNREIQCIGKLIDQERESLTYSKSALVKRFDERSSIYPHVESLGSETNLSVLQQFLNLSDNADEQKEKLEGEIATLRADVVGKKLTIAAGSRDVLDEAHAFSEVAVLLDVQSYNGTLAELVELRSDQQLLREQLFSAAANPAEIDETWESFIHSGNEHRKKLERRGIHDMNHCLYCRQPLSTEALELIARYREFIESQIARDIQAKEATVQKLIEPFEEPSLTSVKTLVDKPTLSTEGETLATSEQMEVLRQLVNLSSKLRQQIEKKATVDVDLQTEISEIKARIRIWLDDIKAECEVLQDQNLDRVGTLEEKQNVLLELEASLELRKSWDYIEDAVEKARRRKRLDVERATITNILRHTTVLANEASDRLVNSSFANIFRRECAELRAPEIQLEFFGRQGSAIRRKKLSGALNLSSVLSEGEQNVIAIADFMAEVRMSENSVPVVFDDPVSSLDHRRVKEVAGRIADLALDHQVVVFTHDIYFTACLLDLLEESCRCEYYRITDDDGKGTITLGTGPRWDSIRNFAKNVDICIREARDTDGETREAHVRDAYASIRSWCEVFVEQEVLAKVTQRLQPNVRITSLSGIKVAMLEETIQTVTSVFEDACRYIEAHSQPLQSLGVAPKLSDLENDWDKLKKCRKEYIK